MKSVLMGFWHLTVAIGNTMPIFIAGSQMFSSQVVEYFMYAGLMVLDMIIFAWLASKYKKTLFWIFGLFILLFFWIIYEF